MQIYIMDSDYEVMKKLESLINCYPNHKAKCFTTHRLLLDAVQKSSPEIVLVDVDAFNGSSVVKAIRSINSETKIIIMSRDEGKVSECFGCESNGFLAKPIDDESLKEQLFRVKHPMLARIKYGSERITDL